MTDHKQSQTWASRFTAALRKVKNNRAYALNEGASLAGAAICKAWHDSRHWTLKSDDDLEAFVERVARHVPEELLQQRGDAEQPLPEIPKDIFGRPLPNPWESGGIPDERAAVVAFSPALAKHMEELAQGRPWRIHNEGLKREASRAITAGIKYGEKEHSENVFRGDNRTTQSEFVNSNQHLPEVVEFYQREASDAMLPWQADALNRTQLGQLSKTDRELFELAQAAIAIQEGWAQERKAIAEAEIEEAQKAIAEAEAKLIGRPDDPRLRAVQEAAAR